jgi:hypothetical protein
MSGSNHPKKKDNLVCQHHKAHSIFMTCC